MHLQRTFQVAGFVLVHDIVLGQLVQHRSNLREKCLGRTLVRRVAECFHGVSCRLVEKTVVCALGYSLTNSLLGWA